MKDGQIYVITQFQSTLSMRRATVTWGNAGFVVVISIHALHEESDFDLSIRDGRTLGISIHALHEESDTE